MDWRKELQEWENKLGDIGTIIESGRAILIRQEIWEAGGEEILKIEDEKGTAVQSFFRSYIGFETLKFIPDKCLTREILLYQDSEGSNAVEYLCGLNWGKLDEEILNRVLKLLKDKDFSLKRKQGNCLTIAASWGNLGHIHKHFPKAITLEGLLEKDFSGEDAFMEMVKNNEKELPVKFSKFSKREILKNLNKLEESRLNIECNLRQLIKPGNMKIQDRTLGDGALPFLDNLIIRGRELEKLKKEKGIEIK